jgi:hypothetical protein
MSEELPDRMPPRLPLPPTTRVPRVFSTWGTVCYGISAITAITIVIAGGIFKWTPPWFLIASAFIYVFISSGLICLGRIDANKDARFFIKTLRQRSDENKRMRKMN